MPNIEEIVGLAESLEEKSVFVVKSKCVAARNRNAKCQKCVEACPTKALIVEKNEINLSHSKCVACGACCAVCPTEALVPLRPSDEELAESIAEAYLVAQGIATFACSRMAARRVVYPETFAEVPCLARMEESILLGLVAQGVEKIHLVDGDCSTCKYLHCVPGIEAILLSVNTLLETGGSSVRVQRSSQFPQELLEKGDYSAYGEKRRKFFTEARGSAKEVAGKALFSFLESEKKTKQATLRDELGITLAGKIPKFEPRRHMQILDALDGMPDLGGDKIETRLWGSIEVDEQTCVPCEMCMMFCPTNALKKVSFESGEAMENLLEFSLADCVQCNSCEDICPKKAIRVNSVVSLAELFDFEPRIIPLKDTRKK